MEKRIAVSDLDGLKKVHDIMVELSLPDLPAADLLAVGKQEGEDFKKAIVRIANNEDGMNEFRDYITGVTCLLTGPVSGALATMGYVNLPRDTLVKLGKECGKEFRSKLSGAARNDLESVKWIQQKITEYGAGTSEFQRGQQSTQNVNPPRVNPTFTQNRPVQQAPQQARTSTNQAPTTRTGNVENINKSRPISDDSQFHNKYPSKPNSQALVGEGSSDEREFFSMTFYGTKSALCFNAVEKDGEHSLTVDGGNKKPNQPEGGRAIDWQDKVIFGFSADELIEFAWVLMGLSLSCEFSGHGPMHDKSLQFKRQDKGFFGSVSAKDKGSRAVPISHAAGTRLMFLVVRQIQKNFPNMTVTEVLNMLRLMANPAKKVA